MLVLKAQAGDRESMDAVVTRWQPRLRPLAVAWARDEATADDAIQEMWISVARGIRGLRDPARFGAWAGQILRRRCTDQARGAARRRSHETATRPRAHTDQRTESDGQDALERAIARLEPETQAMLRLLYIHAQSIATISELTGVPEGTVKSRLHRARATLADALQAPQDTGVNQ